jgi:hypothetical protein
MKARLRLADLLPEATIGLRTRPGRAALSILGVAIGIAAIVAVLGITRSSQADVLARIDRLGTNLLTVVNGRSFDGAEAPLPATATTAIVRTDGVLAAAPTAESAWGVRVPQRPRSAVPERWARGPGGRRHAVVHTGRTAHARDVPQRGDRAVPGDRARIPGGPRLGLADSPAHPGSGSGAGGTP